MSAASWGRPRPTSTPWRARGGHGRRHPANAKTEISNSHSSKTWRLGERLLTSGWRSPASSSLGARRALWLRPTSPPPHPQSPPRRALAPQRLAGTSAARAASLMDCMAAGAPAPAPGAGSSSASAALGEGSAGSHLSGRARPPSLSSSFSSSDDEYSEVAGEESPCCSRSRNSSLFCSRRSRRRILFSFLRALGLGAWADRTARRSRSPSVGDERKIRPRRCAAGR
jgi:hypothetical protein